jgi:1,4-alpha-glucan branching enzyme
VQRWVADLNGVLSSTPSLYELDNDSSGFRWVVGDDAANSVYAFLRFATDGSRLLFVANFTPVVRADYRIGVPASGVWNEVLNSDDLAYGGSGVLNGPVASDSISTHGYDQSIELTIPPLAAVFLRLES